MMQPKKIYQAFAALTVVSTVFVTCTKKWDEHNEITDPNLKNNLYQAISTTANLGKFSDMLVKSGYDKIISASKTYTVWAPTDQALQSLDPAIVNDTARLKQFVGNHIANQSYLADATSAAQRIAMLNGKYNTMQGIRFDSASMVTTNQYANNGVFHIIDKFIPRYNNCWEFVKNTGMAPLNKAFLLSLNYDVLDSASAIQVGVDPLTGKPIYQPGTGIVQRNTFLKRVMDVNNEAGQYTLILLTDAAYTVELNKLTPWFKTSTADSTDRLSSFHLVRDLAFQGVYTAAQLPDTIISQYGVKVPINKPSIVASYKTSNGIVHIMKQVDFSLASKFQPIIIQGENPTAFAADRSVNTFYRIRNDSAGIVFRDILMQNYNVASYYINYLVKNVNSMRYKAYWRAVNDVQTTPLWQQRLAIDSSKNVNFPYVTVDYRNYNEVYLGQFTVTGFRNVNLYVVGPPTASSSGGNNSITLDYIKLVPAF
jgi:uncharacterized surface protein with fasciclin (FAS1) repeats